MLSRRNLMRGSSAALIAGAAPRAAWGKTQADVIIIGAGLAGLYAAHKLEVAGLKVILIEGERRVGGRLHTLDHLPGKPEAGGVQVGSGYKLLRAIADDLKIGLTAGGDEPRGALYRVGGETITEAQWPNAPANRLAGAERKILPAALGGFYNARLPKLTATDAWLTSDALDVPYVQSLDALGASAEAKRLIAANLNGNGLASLSTLHIARSSAIFRSGPGPVFTIDGGAQRLPETMAHGLKSNIRLGQIVTGIAEESGGVRVQLSGGKSLSARRALCTIPFASLRSIKVEGAYDESLKQAIATLPYTHASFVYLSAREAFWKSDGLPETLWSDDPLLGRVFVLGNDPPMLKVWLSGPNADALDAMPRAVAGTEIIKRLETARPSAKGKLTVAGFHSWQKSPFARGIYHHLSPGSGALMAKVVRARGTRLLFAGEHLAIRASGMEGALESGLRAAQMIIATA
jgi:monoamine oxidase